QYATSNTIGAAQRPPPGATPTRLFCSPATAAPEVANRGVCHQASGQSGGMPGMAVARKPNRVKPADAQISAETLKRWYADMLLIRRFEERAGQMYGMGLIGGFCHLYIGQEAVVVGVQAALQEGDTIITSYRDHGHMLACGMDPKGVMSEVTGRRCGDAHGKRGELPMF